MNREPYTSAVPPRSRLRRAVAAVLFACLVAMGMTAFSSPAAAGECVSAFPDVAPDDVHCATIAWMSHRGITQPVGGSFGPTQSVTRGQLAAFIFRFENRGATAPECRQPLFADVAADSLFCGHIQWAAARGLVVGYPDGAFKADRAVTRGALAAVFHRLLASGPAPACSAEPASDVPVGSEFCGVISWMVSAGLTAGAACDESGPGGADLHSRAAAE